MSDTDESLIDIGEEQKPDATTEETVLKDVVDPVVEDKTNAGKPDGLDDALWDAENNTFKGDKVYEKLTAAEKQARDLREKLSRRGAPPETPDGYKVQVEDAEGKRSGWADLVPDDDPVLKAAKDVAHELGLTQAQFAPLVKKVLDVAYEGMAAAATQEPTAEQKAEWREAEMAKLGANGPAVVRSVSEFVRQNIGVHFDERSTEEIKAITSTASGVHFLNQIREMVGGQRLPMASSGDLVSGLPTDAEIYAEIGNEKYGKDPAFTQKVDKWLEKRVAAGRPVNLQV